MKRMIWTITIGLAVLSNVVSATAQQQAPPQVQPSLVPPSKAAHPEPPREARPTGEKNSVGKGALTVTTAQPVSFWQERIAVSGSTVTTDFLYDPNLGVLYGYREDQFICKNGQTESGGIMEALYTADNKAGKAVGSGWFAVALDAGECGAKESGIYGCKFDAHGDPTECGVATINNQTGEIDVVVAQ